MVGSGRLSELAEIIQTRTQAIQAHLKSKNLPAPPLDPGAPPVLPLPPELQFAQSEIINASLELNALVSRPMLHMFSLINPSTHLLTAIHAIHQFQIARNLKPDEQLTFNELATRCDMDELDLRRVIRSCLAWQIFSEPRKGVVAHNAVSLAAAQAPFLDNYIGAAIGVLAPAAIKGTEQMRKWPGSQDPAHSGYARATRRDGVMFDILRQFPDQAENYTKMMDALGSTPMLHSSNCVRDLQWTESDIPKTIVDIGGANGALCAAVLRKFPEIQTGIVQDLAEVVAQTEIPDDLKSRLQFQVHDFFDPQPVKGDVVFFLRQIIYDWPEPQCIAILRNLVPALRDGARLIIHEQVLPEHGQASISEERMHCGFDLVMKITTNS